MNKHGTRESVHSVGTIYKEEDKYMQWKGCTVYHIYTSSGSTEECYSCMPCQNNERTVYGMVIKVTRSSEITLKKLKFTGIKQRWKQNKSNDTP